MLNGTIFSTVAMGRNKNELRVISCHLGNGCSVTASKGGVSLDTSMGLGPLEGLMMGQRSGDVDPTLVQIMNKKLGLSLEEIMSILNTQSGFKGKIAFFKSVTFLLTSMS